ncbi:GNAT family N-acetyltransferase [Terribacillus sp. 7520-G]|uniref:GNAT family N-acetyltransferase n=1 Tax=Terribacillus sp. 7520-G TaxID=2025389 RepID=UPI0013044C3E|nr:GNAT family N-acetyltransferase [Terribacillus sp. 7520-G]
MTALQAVTAFAHEQNLRKSFNKLARKTFGFDFELLYESGLWNERYHTHAFADDAQIVANVSVSALTVHIHKQKRKAIQIGTVMTDPGYQNQGLATKLLQRVIQQYEDETDLIYLFSRPGMEGFYGKLGFTAVEEYLFSIPVSPELRPVPDYRKLQPAANPQDMVVLLDRYGKRCPQSDILDISDAQHLLGFHTLYDPEIEIIELLEPAALLIYKKIGQTMHLYEVISQTRLVWKQIEDYIAQDGITEVIFHFTPTFPDLEPISHKHTERDTLFVNKPELLPAVFQFPEISHA